MAVPRHIDWCHDAFHYALRNTTAEVMKCTMVYASDISHITPAVFLSWAYITSLSRAFVPFLERCILFLAYFANLFHFNAAFWLRVSHMHYF